MSGKEEEARKVREAINTGLSDQKTMQQLSTSGAEAKRKREGGKQKREAAAEAEKKKAGEGSSN